MGFKIQRALVNAGDGIDGPNHVEYRKLLRRAIQRVTTVLAALGASRTDQLAIVPPLPRTPAPPSIT